MDRFVIWGIGERGEWMARLLSPENIAVYVDRNNELQGKNYKGILVISPEKYEKDYKDYPIIVTPEGYEEEIKLELQDKGVQCIFKYRDNFDTLLGYSLLKESLIKELLNTSTNLYLYGITPLAILLGKMLTKCNICWKLIANASTSIELKRYVSEVLKINLGTWEEVGKKCARVILTEKAQGGDFAWIEQYQAKIESYYNLMAREDLFYYSEIAKFKDIHAGKRCFIVATGPSIRIEDLETLRAKQEICISLNSIFKAFPQTKWRPDYYMASDGTAVRRWKKDILQMDVEHKFIADAAWVFENEEIDERLHRWHIYLGRDDENEIPFSADFAKGAYWGKSIVYDGALQMAAYMGFSQIYLLGVDMSYLGKADRHYGHFYAESTLTSYGHSETVLAAFRSARQYAEAHSFKIYNVTRGGRLEVFERVDFDSLF